MVHPYRLRTIWSLFEKIIQLERRHHKRDTTAGLNMNRLESPNPADMRDGRIVDYTLNKRLFPVPLFPNHQKLPTNDDIRYARISVPVRTHSGFSVGGELWANAKRGF